MILKTVFLILGATLTFVSIFPYLLDTVHKKTKPRIVTWFNWALLTGVATAAALADKQYPSAALTGAGAVACIAVVVLGLKHGDRKFEVFDVICQAGAMTGFILWIVFNSPLIAIVATILIDFIAALPTIKHCWQKPQEETTVTYVMTVVGAIFELLALNQPHVSGVLFPAYIVALDVGFAGLLLISPHRHEQPTG